MLTSILAFTVSALAISQPIPQNEDASGREATIVGGRVLLPNKVPAAGIVVKLRGSELSSANRPPNDESPDWEDMKIVTGASGQFEFDFELRSWMTVTVEIEPVKYAAADWWLPDLEAGDHHKMGDLVLEETGTITGRIVDANGIAMPDSWKVLARRDLDPFDDGRGPSFCNAEYDRHTGTFSIDRVPPGTTKISATNSLANWIKGPVVKIVAGQNQVVEVRYNGPDLSKRITVMPWIDYNFMFGVPAKAITLEAPGQEPIIAQEIPGSSNSYSFDDLDPELLYTIRIEDRRLTPWIRKEVPVGTTVGAALIGNSSIRLSVLDPNGKPVPRYHLLAEIHSVNHIPNSSVLIEANSVPPADGLFRGFVPGRYTLRIHAVGFEPKEVALPYLKSGQTQEVVAQLTVPGIARIEGVVRDSEGTPIANQKVLLYQPALLRDSPKSPFESMWVSMSEDTRTHRKKLAQTTTNEEGRFEFVGLEAGKKIVRVFPAPGLEVVREIQVAPGNAEWLDVICEPFSFVVGQLKIPPGASYDRLEVCIGMRAHAPDCSPDDWDLEMEAVGCFVQLDGSYRVGPFPPGKARLALLYSDQGKQRDWGDAIILRNQEIEIGKAEECRVDLDLRHDFMGKVDVALRVNGEEQAGYVLVLKWYQAQTVVGAPARMVTTGGEHELRITPPDGRFAFYPKNLIQVPAGGIGSVRLDLELIEQELTLECTAGHPISASTPVNVYFEDRDYYPCAERVTSPGGKLLLSYPADSKLRIELPSADTSDSDGWLEAEQAQSLPLVNWIKNGPSPQVVLVKCSTEH